MRALAILIVWAGVARADNVFPVIPGTTLTFASTDYKDTWHTKLVENDGVDQYVPSNDIINYVTKAGFSVKKDGLYVVGEVLEGERAPPAARAIAFPIHSGAVGKVPGFLAATYTVGAREKVVVKAGTFDAWKITVVDKANPSGAFWLAPGTGIVKIQQPSGRIDELVTIEAPSHGKCDVVEHAGEDPVACDQLGVTLINKDDKAARALFERACAHGKPAQCANLAFMLEHGRGGAADATRAIDLYTKACDDGSGEACFNLGAATEYGLSGVKRDVVRAVILYDKACKLGLTPGCEDRRRLTGQ
jgi:hypothetical protein